MAFDPNTFSQNPMLAAIMARTMGGASGMPVPQEAMPGGGAIEGTIQQTAEQEVDLPKLIGERLDLKMAPPSSRGGVLAGGLAIALQNAWNARTKNKEIELENAIKKNDAIRQHKQKLEDLKAEKANKEAYYKAQTDIEQNTPEQLLKNDLMRSDLEGRQLRNANIGQPRGGGGGRQVSGGSMAPIAESMTGEQLDMLLKANGITRAQWELMNPKQQQQMIPKLVGRNKRSESDIINDLSRLPDVSLNPYVEVRQKELEAELAESRRQSSGGAQPGGSETSGSKANSLLQKGLSGGTQAAPPTQTTPAVPTDVQGNRQYTPEEIINIINATKGNMPNNPKIKFDKKKF